MDFASEIKERLTLPEIARHYGFTPNRQGRMPCPFHNGKDPNLGLKDRYYNCFVCGAKGDAIKFVQELFGLNFSDTISKINSDFSLARNETTPATSSGVPSLPKAELSIISCLISSVTFFVISVWINPGATTLTFMPFGPNSFASAFVKAIMAPFEAL